MADTIQRAAARVIDAWDSTVLPVANDGRLQEAMEDLRAAMAAMSDTPTLREAAAKALGMELATKHAVYLTAESAGKLVDLVLRAALAEHAAEQASAVQAVNALNTWRPVRLEFGVTMHRDHNPPSGGEWLKKDEVLAAVAGAAPAAEQAERKALETYLKECDDFAIVPDVGGAWAAAWRAARAENTTPTLREAAQQALEALVHLTGVLKAAGYATGHADAASCALSAALAEQDAEQAEPVETIECTCRAEDMPYGRCCKAPPLKTTDRWGSARVADYNAGWNACCAAMVRSSTPAEPWGWAIVDANGDECSTRPRVKRFFGAVNHEVEPFTAEDVAHADRENPGVAPHRIVTLYAAPPAPARQEPLACGHHASLAVVSAESGETLYCELCDDKAGRRDAELREQELQAELAALRIAPPAPARQEPLTDDERQREFFTGVCVALTSVVRADDPVLWAEVVRTCGDALIYHAAHIEPDEWELAGFKKYLWSELKKRKPRKVAAPVTAAPAEGDKQ